LKRLSQPHHPDLLVGINTADDAGVFRLDEETAIVNTVDFFTPIVDDPYTFGQIAAANALSDVYAMGGRPLTALNIACFPRDQIALGVLAEILRGSADKVAEAGAVTVGGHTVADDELKFGLAVTGIVHPDEIIRNVGAEVGDALVLTKPLGTGIVSTALKHERASDEACGAAVEAMCTLNRTASEAMCANQAHACTDITGFGLLGHAEEMARASGVTLRFRASCLPLLPDVLELARAGEITGGGKRNRSFLDPKVRIDPAIQPELVEVLFDPQTSGGLLVALEPENAQEMLRALNSFGMRAWVVGDVVRRSEVSVEVTV